ncbi:hypothetical protein BKD09_27120 [Bradyrhizobium japonicum]|uniref:Thiamine biosynthesis protein ThiF n=2 Tax=Bradyrhizobium japonicum TaxID=375 RepID=A0A1L3FFE0_BRAJP|nr:hypothetical protein BKD09_27120 [Bradyrhizobium japonicum]
MNDIDLLTDSLNRLVKLALDSGEASSVEEAERIFADYRMQIVVGPDVAESAVLQAALLTAVNCASRCMLGGVTVVGACGSLRVALPSFGGLPDTIRGLGARTAGAPDPAVPTLVIGDVMPEGIERLAIRATFAHWCGGVVPLASGLRLAENGLFTPAGVLAGAIGVAEIFQRLRGGLPVACRRAAGLDLWDYRRDWMCGTEASSASRLPSSAWIIGLGNLGQAYLWTLALLPYGGEAAELVMQDVDVLAPSNLSTSLLTFRDMMRRKKTRALADWADARGFKTRIIERPFAADFRIGGREPPVALVGVDNALARQAVEDVGFARVIEAGLGRGPQDFLGIDLHTFPASKSARQVWADISSSDPEISQPAYRAMLEGSGDRCGIVRLAGRSIGAPFVGAVAGSMVVSELLRLSLGGPRHELGSCHLRDLQGRTIVMGTPWEAFNPGSVGIAA